MWMLCMPLIWPRRSTPRLPRGTAKAVNNGSDTALVIPHGHHDGTLLRQMGLNFWHRNTLQERMLHLVLETALPTSCTSAIAHLAAMLAVFSLSESGFSAMK